jgi:hypothetical protein
MGDRIMNKPPNDAEVVYNLPGKSLCDFIHLDTSPSASAPVHSGSLPVATSLLRFAPDGLTRSLALSRASSCHS